MRNDRKKNEVPKEFQNYSKMVKEAVGCEIKDFSSELNCMAIQVKLELYTSETIWKNSDMEQNRMLLTFIEIVEQNLMDKTMRIWNIDM